MASQSNVKNNKEIICAEVAGGIYTSQQLQLISELAAEDIIVKATENQRLALVVSAEESSSVIKRLEEVAISARHYCAGLHQPVCDFGDLIEGAEQDALEDAIDLTHNLEGLELSHPLKIGINSNSECLAPCHTLDISIVGETAGYRIALGGKNSQFPELATFIAEGVPAEELSDKVKSIIEIYKEKSEDGESMKDLIERAGVSDFVKALSPYSQDAADDLDFGIDSDSSSDSDVVSELNLEELPTEDQDMTNKDDVNVDLDDLSLDELDSIGEEDKLGAVDVGSLEGLDDGPVMEDDIQDLDGFSEPSSDVEILDENTAIDDISMDDIAVDEISDVSLDNDDPIVELEQNHPALGEDFDAVQEVAVEESQQEDLEKDLSSIEDINEDPELLEEDSVETDSDEIDIDTSMSMDDLDEDDEISSDATELSADDEAGFEEKLAHSIEEESKLIQEIENDENEDARKSALNFLDDDDAEAKFEEIQVELDLDQDAHDDIETDQSVANIKDYSDSGVKKMGKKRVGLNLVGFEIDENESAHLEFHNGIKISFELQDLENGEERTMSILGDKVSITKDESGYKVCVAGLSMFYPIDLKAQVS